MAARLLVHEEGGRVRVDLQRDLADVPEPGATFDFEPPLTAEDREALRWYLEDYLIAPFGVYEDRGPAIAARIPRWGERLFDALFGVGKPGRDAYLRAVALGGAELFLVSTSPAFLGLPWELCRDPERGALLAFDLAGFTRNVPGAGGAAKNVPGDELRVLMVIARPAGAQDVRYGIVARPLLALREKVSERVRIDLLRPPTVGALKAKIRAAREAGKPYHVLHFDGHGAFGRRPAAGEIDPRRFRGPGEGYLSFESETGGEDPVSAADFAGWIEEHRIPIFVFNACRSGTLADDAGPDATVATRLLQGGALSVVAMGYTVYAVAAAEFMAAFYDALFRGKTTAQAVAEGRKQMRHADQRPSPKGKLPLEDWVVPVHYARRVVAFPGLVAPRPEKTLAQRLAEAAAEAGTTAAPGELLHALSPLAAERGLFVGRDRDFYLLERAVRDPRAIVIHGEGGAGKTELAKAFARWLLDSGGVERVAFHSFEPGVATFGIEGVINALGQELAGAGFFKLEAGARRRFVIGELRERPILLVWDNVETVCSMPDPNRATPPLDEAGQEAMRSFLHEVMREGRSAVILTSRSHEAWLGEDVRRLPLRGLDAEEAGEYADRLLAPYPESAPRRRKRAFGELMTMLDGHPLSLRLVLPHLAKEEPEMLVAALRGEHERGGVFGEEGGRHDSLGACVAYSFGHLAEEHRKRLVAVALFEGVADGNALALMTSQQGLPARFQEADSTAWEATLEAATEIGLLSRVGRPLYRIHPALPAYVMALWRTDAKSDFAEELLAAQQTFAAAYARYAKWMTNEIHAERQRDILAFISVEARTIGQIARNALRQGQFRETEALLRVLYEYWRMAGHFEEVGNWNEQCRLRIEEQDGATPNLDTPAGSLWLFVTGVRATELVDTGEYTEAEAIYDGIRHKLEASADTTGRLAVTYHQLGRLAGVRDEFERARDLYERAAKIEDELGDRRGLLNTYHSLGNLELMAGNLDKGQNWYEKAGVLLEEVGGQRDMLAALYYQIGMVEHQRGTHHLAQQWYKKAMVITLDIGDRRGLSKVYYQLGRLAHQRGDRAEAEQWYTAALAIDESLSYRPGMALNYTALGVLTIHRSVTEALDWLVRATTLFPDFNHPMTQVAPEYIAGLTSTVGFPALEASWQRATGKPLPAEVRAFVEDWIASHPKAPA